MCVRQFAIARQNFIFLRQLDLNVQGQIFSTINICETVTARIKMRDDDVLMDADILHRYEWHRYEGYTIHAVDIKSINVNVLTTVKICAMRRFIDVGIRRRMARCECCTP